MTPEELKACNEVYGDMKRTSIENRRILNLLGIQHDLKLADKMGSD